MLVLKLLWSSECATALTVAPTLTNSGPVRPLNQQHDVISSGRGRRKGRRSLRAKSTTVGGSTIKDALTGALKRTSAVLRELVSAAASSVSVLKVTICSFERS